MPETREEAVRRMVTLSCTGREKYGLAFDAGEKFGREAALREAVAAVFKPFSYTAPDSHGVCAICNYYCTSAEKITLASNHYKDCKALALMPVAEKEEKA